jgi:hypothetical protein
MPLPTPLAVPHAEHQNIVVDAVGGEAAWANALSIPAFVQWYPRPGAAPQRATAVRITSDDEALYLLIEAAEPDPADLKAGYGRHDARDDDRVGIYLDPAGDGQRAYLFVVNALGVQRDGVRTASATGDDHAWDGRWQSAGRITETGFVVEMAIPWATLRHPPRVDTLGMMVYRYRPVAGEQSGWPPTDASSPGWLTQEALVGGPGPLPQSPSLDLIPELTYGVGQGGVAVDRLNIGGLSPGLTARWSPRSSVQALVTLNPDFSQVESDAAQVAVNRRYALTTPEKRPFFLEGQEWFQHPAGALVYTRSMAAPRYGLRSTAEGGGVKAAVLHTYDALPTPSVNEGGGWTEADIGEAGAYETVMRLRRQLGPGSDVGFLFSDRSLPEAGLYNEVVGLDARAQVGSSSALTSAALFSSTTGIDATTVLAPKVTLNWNTGGPKGGFELDGDYVHPDFRAENGFLTRSDWLFGGANAWRQYRPKEGALQRATVTPVDLGLGWDTSGELRSFFLAPMSSLRFVGNHRVAFGLERAGETFADVWLDSRTAWVNYGAPLSTDWEISTYAYVGQSPFYDPVDPFVGEVAGGTATTKVQINRALSFSASAEGERFTDEGALVYQGIVSRLRVEAFASPHHWARLILDRSTFDELRGAELLFAWEDSPGTAAYLGGNLRGDGDPDNREWAALAKLSYALSP